MKSQRRIIYFILGIAAILVVGSIVASVTTESDGPDQPLRVAISPYQDIAMLVNVDHLGLEQKYGTEIELVTLGWEEILPAVASAGPGVDVGFGGYIEYLTKYENINAGSSDPVLFIYPLYVFKGGAFVTFDDEVPELNRTNIQDSPVVQEFLSYRFGAQQYSVYEMMLAHIAGLAGVPFDSLNVVDTPLDQGFLAARAGSIDIAEAGLTQLTETIRMGGRSVVTMEDIGFADLTGFIVKKSVYEARKGDVHNLVRMWFDSVDYVFADIDQNSQVSRDYLTRTASTRYSLDEYKSALSQEYLPRTLSEANSAFLNQNGPYSYERIGRTVADYLMRRGIVSAPPVLPKIEKIE